MLSSGFDIETVSKYKVTGNTVGFWTSASGLTPKQIYIHVHCHTLTHTRTHKCMQAYAYTKKDMHIHMRRVEGYLEAGKIVETVKVLVISAWRTEPDPQNPLKVKGENKHHKVVL